MNNNTTAIAQYLALCNQFGVEPDYIPFTTLNESLGILAGDPTSGGTILSDAKTQFLVMGNGGHSTPTQGNISGIAAKVRLPQFQGLYNILPQVLRLPSNDLTIAEASKYRLRKTVTYGGQTYHAHYACELDLGAVKPVFELEVNDNGTITRTPYVYDATNLTHGEVAPVVDAGITQRLVTSFTIDYEPTAQQLEDVRNACNIIYGTDGFAVISELGLVSGVDTPITASLSDGSGQINELVNAQLVTSFSAGRLLDFGVSVDLTTLRVGTAPVFQPTL